MARPRRDLVVAVLALLCAPTNGLAKIAQVPKVASRLLQHGPHAIILMKSSNQPPATTGDDDDAVKPAKTTTGSSSIDKQMLAIGIPAMAGLAIDPIASLVDTAMIGRYCAAADLAGAGVAIGAYNLIARCFNFLSSAVTSQIAAVAGDTEPGEFNVDMSRNAAAALLVACTVGAGLALAMTLGGARLLAALGVAAGSPVHKAAMGYLSMRAVAFPASLSLMALQGAFRGARDTKSPLGALAFATFLNIGLDPLLIVVLGWGVVGAAAATTASQYAAALVLWRQLTRRCGDACATAEGRILGLPRPQRTECLQIARAGSWLTLRTFAGSAALAYSSVAASALSAASGAGHQICYQLWLATSLLADAIAVAAQALTATAVAKGDGATVGAVRDRALVVAALCGGATAAALAAMGKQICRFFSADPLVLLAAATAWPFVVATQPLNTIAFGLDGLLFGASDFRFCAAMQLVAATLSLLCMLLAPTYGLPAVWAGLGIYMLVRCVMGWARIKTATGPWELLRRGADSSPAD